MGALAQMVGQQTQHAARLISILSPTLAAGRLALRTLFLVIFFVTVNGSATADSTTPATTHTQLDGSSLFNKYLQLKDALAQSIFGAPILFNSDIGDVHAQGEVYVLLDSSLPELILAFSKPAQWCDLVILHINIKACTYQQNQVTFYAGRKHYQTPDEAFALQYSFENLSPDEQHLKIKLSAADGPFDTSNYLIKLEAIAIDEQHSFMRFTYRYHFGFIANMAVQTYLATLGRNKVGFTVTGTDEQGQPIYIKGLQGIVERNVMRYIFAIQSMLETKKSATEYRPADGIRRWYTHIQKFPRQLVSLSFKEYRDNKKRELNNQREMQKALLR